ncbi:MAG: MFS transporter [Hydrogenothermaceae bacterium]|nr:MFS transporter [Hydrogenothermaceae bacterium]
MKRIRKNLLIVNLITMLFFASTEIVESILPFFLVTYLGASMLIVGIIEGFSEGFSNFLKIVGGYFSDFKRRKRIVVFGLISFMFSSVSLFFVKRWSDLILSIVLKDISEGSLIPAKDYILSSSYKIKKAEIFSLNRIFENAGEFLGVFIVFLYSMFFMNYSIYYLFFVSLLFSTFALLIFLNFREKRLVRSPKKSISWKILYPNYLLLFSIFSFINFGYSFYILKVYSQTESVSASLGFYLVFSIILIVGTFFSAKLFDKIGESKFLEITFLTFFISHILFILLPVAGFLSVAVADAMFEIGIWGTLGNKIKYRQGFVFGAYHFLIGITSLLSGVFLGYIWDVFGSDVPFWIGAVISIFGYLVLKYLFRR